jgi:hypothetical protein
MQWGLVDIDMKNGNNCGTSSGIHPDLFMAQKNAYEPSGLIIENVVKETESEDYGAFDFEMNNRRIKFRVGKITPTKIGQFVTLWKRVGSGPILPYDMADPFDLFVVSVRDGERSGQFVFSKRLLCQKGVISKEGKGGKRAIRVYPPWNKTDNRQAKNTQSWQLTCFFEIPLDACVNVSNIQKLFFVGLFPCESHA